DYLLQFVKTIAHYKLNMISVEYSNKFPYAGKYEVIRDADAFTEEEIEAFVACCHAHCVEIVPFVQSFGHMEYVLHHDHFAYMREDPGFASQCCPLLPDSIHMTRELLGQIVTAHRYSTQLFIGGDETFHLGKCPKCAEFVERRGKGGLYVHYLNEIAKVVF